MAWKALKTASLLTDLEAVEGVLSSKTSWKLPKRKNRSGSQVLDDEGRFDPTSTQWQEILENSPAVTAKTAAPKRKTAVKGAVVSKSKTVKKATVVKSMSQKKETVKKQ